MSFDTGLLTRTVAGFQERFGRRPKIVVFAPGRVNLIGEHTDYNDGFALPCALSVGTIVALGARTDNSVAVCAIDLESAQASFALDASIPRVAQGHWENHLRGIMAGMPRFGLPVCGADLAFSGDIPQGSGLSSSASLGVALALGMAALAGNATPDPLALAKVAQWSEHEYVGCACGLMDQLASVRGEAGHALLLDCRSLATRPIAFPDDTAIMIVHSGITRGLFESAYNERRDQCARAATHYGVPALRDLDITRLETGRGRLDATAFRRARHVVSENERTRRAARAMAERDLATLGIAMRASHLSLRDDFAVSLPPIDDLVDCLSDAIGNEGGARMTGGGFGGCVVAILPTRRIADVETALAAHWQSRGLTAQWPLIARPARGAHIVSGW